LDVSDDRHRHHTHSEEDKSAGARDFKPRRDLSTGPHSEVHLTRSPSPKIQLSEARGARGTDSGHGSRLSPLLDNDSHSRGAQDPAGTRGNRGDQILGTRHNLTDDFSRPTEHDGRGPASSDFHRSAHIID
jgi:hypothetical protein